MTYLNPFLAFGHGLDCVFVIEIGNEDEASGVASLVDDKIYVFNPAELGEYFEHGRPGGPEINIVDKQLGEVRHGLSAVRRELLGHFICQGRQLAGVVRVCVLSHYAHIDLI